MRACGHYDMQARKILFLQLLFVVFLISFAPTTIDGEENGVLLYEIMSDGETEGVSLYNYGTEAVDLKNYIISDGEGNIIFKEKLMLNPSCRITIVLDVVSNWFCERDLVYCVEDSDIILEKQFRLNNGGDQVILYDNDGKIKDIFAYGNCDIPKEWNGETFKRIPKNNIAIRISEGNGAENWIISKDGNFVDVKPEIKPEEPIEQTRFDFLI